jgi:hypothetical protein
MTRSVWVIAGAVAGLAVVLVGAWLVLAGRGPDAAGAGAKRPTVALTTELSWPPDPSDGSNPPDPYPTVPSAQMRGDRMSAWMVRTDGPRLLVQVMETDCTTDEVRLLGEHPDRVEVEIRTVVKPLPASVTANAGTKGVVCGGVMTSDGPYAVVELSKPLGERTVEIHRVP